MIILENQSLLVAINPHGAELTKLYHKGNGLDYLWDGDPAFWPKHSPVLFPIIGKLIDDTYIYQGRQYTLPKHGFARDNIFEVESKSKEVATFELKSNPDTLKVYPFNFILRIRYELEAASLVVTYEVETSDEMMYFSIGAHPAFKVPLTEDRHYEDYYLEFEKQETADRITVGGSYVTGSEPYLEKQTILPLNKELFYDDAVILTGLKSGKISIKSQKDSHGIHFNFKNFPYMGLWASINAPFICLEPWCGLPDEENHDQHLENKEAIILLKTSERFTRQWSVECF